MKTCTYCGVPKPLDEFKKNRYSNDGYATRCKVCSNAHHAKHRANMTPEQRAKEKAYNKRYDKLNKKKINARRVARRLEFKAKQEADMNAKHMAWVQAQRSQALADEIIPDDAVNEFPVKVTVVVAPMPGGLFEAPVAVDMSAQFEEDMAKFDEIPDEDMDLGDKRLADAIKANTTKGDK